ncbi:MAG: hypothetical protein IPK80_12790 [Nannocystis sp.]|nr:hypothetical protein [Nannocystis sp.]
MVRSRSSLTLLPLALSLSLGAGCDETEATSDRKSDDSPQLKDDQAAHQGKKKGKHDQKKKDKQDKKDKEDKKEHKKLVKDVRKQVKKHKIEPMPAAPEIRPELVELGQLLAFDKILSGNENISCMTCHHPLLASDDDLHLSIGEGGVGLGVDRTHPEGIFIPRNAPHLFNLHTMDVMFWDGRVRAHADGVTTPAREEVTPEMIEVFEFGAVSAQAMFPVTSRREMRGRLGDNDLSMIRDDNQTPLWEGLMARLGQIDEYRDRFEEAYPGTDFEEMSFAHAANAIAAFEIAGFASNDSPWDQFLRGDDDALSNTELKGAKLFLGDAQCVTCHSGQNLSDLDFHNIALPQFGPGKGQGLFRDDDLGRGGRIGDPALDYHFRTPPLRNTELTGPWGHAGQFADLGEFIAHYIDPIGSLASYDVTQIDPLLQPTLLSNHDAIIATLSPEMAAGLNFTHADVPALVEFMEALTDEAVFDLTHLIPDAVPSGLPVEENVVTDYANRAGTVDVRMGFNTSGAYEMQIWEPSMCEGEAAAQVTFDRNAGTFSVDAQFDGLPYRPTYCYDYNPSNDWNQYPDCVEDGRWQIWIVGRFFTKRSVFWYDGATGQLIANEHDLTGPLPPTAFPLEMPVGQMLCTDFFESDPDTLQASMHAEYDYNGMLDMLGSAGVYFSVLPKNLFNPTDLIVYYTQGGLPPDQAMDFDDVIDDIANDRGGMMVVTSYEPFPKPSYLDARDNIMIGWGGAWPEPLPVLEPPVECGTNFQWDGEFGLAE